MNNTEYNSLIEYLFGRIAISSSGESLNELTSMLTAFATAMPENVRKDGVIEELRLWIGLKLDGNAVAHKYGDGIVADFPEYFTELRSYVTYDDINAETILTIANANVSAMAHKNDSDIELTNTTTFRIIEGRVEYGSW